MEKGLKEMRNINLKIIEDLKGNEIFLFWCCHKIKMKISKETAESLRRFFYNEDVKGLTIEGISVLQKLKNIKEMIDGKEREEVAK